jgi:hypothetical protein
MMNGVDWQTKEGRETVYSYVGCLKNELEELHRRVNELERGRDGH